MKLFATRHSHAELYVHAVWATKDRVEVLDRELRFQLSEPAAGTSRTLGAEVLAFGGVEDHVHVLLRYRPDLAVADLVRSLKASFTRKIRRDVADFPDFAWQTGYGAAGLIPTRADPARETSGHVGFVENDRAFFPSPRRSCAGSNRGTVG